MKEKALEVRLNDKQIEVYESFIEAINEIKRIVKEFDGKCLNVDMEIALKESSVFDDLDLYVSMQDIKLWGRKEIAVYANNDYIKFNKDDSHSVELPVEVNGCYFEIFTDENKIDAERTIVNIDIEKDDINRSINRLKTACTLYDDMLIEYTNLRNMIQEYRFKYDYSIRKYYDKFDESNEF